MLLRKRLTEVGSVNDDNGVKDVALPSSCLCCRTKEEFESNKKLGYLVNTLNELVPLTLLRLDDTNMITKIKNHSRFLWEVAE